MRFGAAQKQVHQRAVVGLAGLWEEGRHVERLSSFGLMAHHVRLALRGVLLSPLNSLLTLISIAVALSLFGVFLLFFQNAQGLLSTQSSAVTMSIFLDDTLARADIEKWQVQVSSHPGVAKAALVTPEAALERFRASLGENAGVLEGLDKENPLPPSLEVSFLSKAEVEVEEVASSLAKELAGKPGIQKVLFDQGLLSQLAAIARSVTKVGLLGVGMLFLMIGFIITSTIRLALHAHRDEIQIMGLVGARHEYVRAPFLIDGGLQGMLGSLLGLGFLYGIFSVTRSALEGAAVSQAFFPEVVFLPWWGMLLFVLVGLGLGVVASWLTLRRFTIEV
jgi:cell division transport system permease protein